MKLWLLERQDNIGYDEDIADVVAAPDEETARRLSNVGGNRFSAIRLIGEAVADTPAGVILNSFNAG